MKPLAPALALLATALVSLTACSARQGHATAQAWQRQQCNQIVDAQERIRCLRDAEQSYDSYRKAAEDARTGR